MVCYFGPQHLTRLPHEFVAFYNPVVWPFGIMNIMEHLLKRDWSSLWSLERDNVREGTEIGAVVKAHTAPATCQQTLSSTWRVQGFSRATMADRSTQLKNSINQKLVETGEKERLKDMLRERLTECGWRDELKVRSVGYTIILHYD